jgi:ribosomal protein S18 acetylase RimI-like enzyme
MAAAVQLDVLDLRHFNGVQMRPLLEEEGRAWGGNLHWDYRNSVELLLGYFDSRSLPGYVALSDGRILGYAFCVYEGHKAIIGDVFASPSLNAPRSNDPGDDNSTATEIVLLRHLIETLQNSPAITRVESQLLLPPYGSLREAFVPAGFRGFERLLLERNFDLTQPPPEWTPHAAAWQQRVTLRRWQEDDFPQAAELICNAYAGHIDAEINDQYRTPQGAARFLHNIVRFPGCGFFDATSSRIARDKITGELAGMVLCSRVRADTGHITQLCVAPNFRNQGLAHALLDAAEAELRYQRFTGLTLTVTAANETAMRLYNARGFHTRHSFEAFVWEK